jgi:DNA polymerase-1
MRNLLIDANHLAARSFHAINGLNRSDGTPSGVVYGVIQSLSHVRKETKIQFKDMICLWDGGSADWRLKIYPEYKGDRKWRQENISPQEAEYRKSYYQQLLVLQEGLKHLGIPQVRVSGVEADDLVGLFAGYFESRNQMVIIFSGDKGLHQCVSDLVSIFDPEKGFLLQDDVEALWKLKIDEILPYRAMVGGKDNIKGVKGIGDVRARKILQGLNLMKSEKESRKLQDLLTDQNEVFNRNIFLMKVSKDWSETHYPLELADIAIDKYREKHNPNSLEFIKFLREWELSKFLDEVGRFL